MSRIFGEVIVKANARLSMFPRKAAPLIVGCRNHRDIQEVRALLERLIEEVRGELRNPVSILVKMKAMKSNQSKSFCLVQTL